MTNPPQLPDPRPARPAGDVPRGGDPRPVPHGRGPLTWVVLGFVAGFLLGLFLSSRAPEVASYSPRTSALFVGTALGLLGAVAGAVGFAVLDLLRTWGSRR